MNGFFIRVPSESIINGFISQADGIKLHHAGRGDSILLTGKEDPGKPGWQQPCDTLSG